MEEMKKVIIMTLNNLFMMRGIINHEFSFKAGNFHFNGKLYSVMADFDSKKLTVRCMMSPNYANLWGDFDFYYLDDATNDTPIQRIKEITNFG